MYEGIIRFVIVFDIIIFILSLWNIDNYEPKAITAITAINLIGLLSATMLIPGVF